MADTDDRSLWTATGRGDVAILCDTSEWLNPNWTAGEIYRTEATECNVVDVPILLEEIKGAA